MAVRVGRRALGGVAQAAGIAVVAVFALLAAWVVVDFNGFFAAFHSLFFGNWRGPVLHDSLLITMYPPEFWIGMGARCGSLRQACCPSHPSSVGPCCAQMGVGALHLRNRAEPTRIWRKCYADLAKTQRVSAPKSVYF